MAGKGLIKILEELNWPPVFVIPPRQFEMLDGEGNRERNRIDSQTVGLSAENYPVITLHPGLRGKVRDNVIYHEILHHLYPHKPHWWIESAAERLASGGGRGYFSRKYGHSPDDLPGRPQLLRMILRQVEKLKRRYRTPGRRFV